MRYNRHTQFYMVNEPYLTENKYKKLNEFKHERDINITINDTANNNFRMYWVAVRKLAGESFFLFRLRKSHGNVTIIMGLYNLYVKI